MTKTGKPRYYFAKDKKGESVDEIPQGYEIEESVNGVVSLVKLRPKLIPYEECACVEDALACHPKARNYRVAVKDKQIIVYERLGPDADRLLDIFGQFAAFASQGSKEQVEGLLDQSAKFTPVMRFILDDAETREYHAERWCYLGSIDDWFYLSHSGKIDKLAKDLTPTLGTDEFYELY